MKLKIRDELTPTNDYIFQCIFGNKGSEQITKDFLNTILEEKIEQIELNHEIVTDKNILEEKVIRLDVKAKINGENMYNKHEFNIVLSSISDAFAINY